jgi:hypothetical protein
MTLTLFIARDKDPPDLPPDRRDDYWLALEAFDSDRDPEDDSVAWHPYQASTCANIGPVLWDALGLPTLVPGETMKIQIDTDLYKTNPSTVHALAAGGSPSTCTSTLRKGEDHGKN